MPDDKKKYIKPPTADAWRFDASPLVYNYDNYLNSLGYRAGISSKNFLHKPSRGGLYYPMSLNFNQSYADNSRAYNANPSKFENPQEVISNIQFGQPTTYTDYTRGPREADMGVDFKVGATTINPSPKWHGPFANLDFNAGYSKLRQGYGGFEGGAGYKFPINNGFSGSLGTYAKASIQNKDRYGTLQDRLIPGQGHIAGDVGQGKAMWGWGLKGDFNYSHPHDNWTVGARGSINADMIQGKSNYRVPALADSGRVEMTPVINAELYAQYPLNYGINKVQRKLEEVKKNDIAPKDRKDRTPSEIDIERLRKISIPNGDNTSKDSHTKPIAAFGMGDEYPLFYKGDNGTHSLFGNVIMPGDVREFKNGGQFDRKFNLPEDSFRQGGNHLHDSIYSSSLEQYPAVYAKGGHMNFKSNAAYKAWLGYGHASGAFERTPGNQSVSVQGHPHNVQHEMGGFLGNPYVNMFDDGGKLSAAPNPRTMSSMTVPERTALIYQAVTQYVNQAKADGRLGPNDNLSVEGVVAQILLETGNGTSSLVKRANNFGGIKADDKWTGPKTGQYRLYSTPEEGLKAQIDFYIDNARYRKNGVFEATTPEEHLAAVKRAGYATAPNYVSAGMSMVKSIKPRLAKVDMTKFDIPASALTNEPTAIVEAPPISQEEIAQGMQPVNRLGIRPLQPLNISPDINTAPEIVPYTTGASAPNQMPNLASEAPSIPKGWFGGGNTIFGGNKQKKFAQGGPMNQLTEFNEGGSHEENPLGGIPQGMNPNGGMNLVQEGETKNNAQDFIYSDDITISKGIAKQFNINSRFVGKTYADASKKANRTDSRRETDTIEQNAIARDLDKLAQAQETQKEEELQKDIAKMAEKHPEFMAQMMQAQQPQAPQPGMQGPSPEEMAMMQQQGQMDPSMQGQPMDPAMMEQMQMQQGMRYGGPMSYKCGGTMYNYGGMLDSKFVLGGEVENNENAVLGADGNLLTGAGNSYSWDTGTNPTLQDQGFRDYGAGTAAGTAATPEQESGNGAGKNAIGGAMAGIGTAIGGGGMAGAPTADKNAQAAQGVKSGIVGAVTAINPIIGGAIALGQGIGTAVRKKTEAVDEHGQLLNEGKAERGYVAGHFFDPVGAAIEDWSNPNLNTGQKLLSTIGLSALNRKAYSEGLEKNARKNMGITGSAENPLLPGEVPLEGQSGYNGTFAQSSGNGLRNGGYLHNAGPMGQPLTNLYAAGGPMPPDNAPYGTPFNLKDRNSWMGDYSHIIPQGHDLNAPISSLPAYSGAFNDNILAPNYNTVGEYVSAAEDWERNRKVEDFRPSITKYVEQTPKTAAPITSTPAPADTKAYFIKGPNNQNQWVDANTYNSNKGPKTTMPLDASGYPVMQGTGGQRYTEYDKSPAGIPAYNSSGRLTYGGSLYNRFDGGGLLRPSNIDYGQFNPNLNNPYYSAQGNTLPTSFNYSGGMNAFPDDFGNYQAPLPTEQNNGVVLNEDGTMLTGTGSAYDWNTGNMPAMPNYLTKKEEKEIEKEIKKEIKKEEEKKKNQFSDYKTEQDAMQDKFSMNETLGQFIGGNLGTGYNLYQGIFGKKSKGPKAKDLFTPVDPYRMNINPQLRAVEETYAGAAKGLMNAAPSGGSYLTNRAILAASEAAARAGIMAQAENAYGTSKMQTDMFNSQNKSQAKLKEYELQSAIDTAKQNYLQAGLQGINEGINASKANQAALIYASMHGGGEYGVEANPYLKQMAMEYQKRKEAKKDSKTA